MSNIVTLVVPEAPSRTEERYRPRVHKRGNGPIRLGILDNGKSNADTLLDLLVRGVMGSRPVGHKISERKLNFSMPADDQTLSRLGTEADFVFSAVGD